MNETVVGEKGMAVAPHRAAAEAAAEVMREGGNALEAMIAAAATIAVVYPHMNSIGGDAFFLIAQPGRPVRAIDAGRRRLARHHQRYRKKGYDTVPPRGPDAALTVAGAVSGWKLAGEIATALGGRIDRRELLADAIAGRARASSSAARSRKWRQGALRILAPCRASPKHFLVDGKAPEIGSRLKLEKLSPTRSIIWPMPASTISTGAMSRRRSPPIWRRSAAR